MKTKTELRALHGTPEEFEEACKRAWIDGYCTFDEAFQAFETYKAEYADASD